MDIEEVAKVPAQWSAWSAVRGCRYNCIEGSTGVVTHRRRCLRGECRGPKKKVLFCDDFSKDNCAKPKKEYRDLIQLKQFKLEFWIFWMEKSLENWL